MEPDFSGFWSGHAIKFSKIGCIVCHLFSSCQLAKMNLNEFLTTKDTKNTKMGKRVGRWCFSHKVIKKTKRNRNSVFGGKDCHEGSQGSQKRCEGSAFGEENIKREDRRAQRRRRSLTAKYAKYAEEEISRYGKFRFGGILKNPGTVRQFGLEGAGACTRRRGSFVRGMDLGNRS
jgi:hypothetical protein